jgi:short-subunit dehydrogenase
VQTEFQEVARRQGVGSRLGPKFVVVPVEQVVRDALAALEADRPLVIPGFAMKFVMFISRLMPMPVLRLVFRLVPTRG